MEADEYNGKTVLLINHTHMVGCFSGDELNLDSGVKFVNTRTVFQKSIWSNLVEAVIQYCRVVFDIFSTEKPISIVTFDDEEKIHSIWLNEDQNLDTIWNIFSQEGPPKTSSLDFLDRGSLPGLSSACHLLQMLTPHQKKNNSSENKGRVVVLSMSMGNQISSWIPDILLNLEKPVNIPERMDVTSSEWVFIDLFPASEFSADVNELFPKRIEPPSSVYPNVRHRFYYHKLLATSQELYQGLMRLAESHYNLSSTLVQDIPMKEEANVNSGSSMYGVEILHRAEVHDMLKLAGLYEKLLVCTDAKDNKSISRPNSGFSKTLGIKWVTPKTSDTNFLRFAVATYRVTLADVCHRASTCLAQFVLGGRSVALAHRLQSSFPALPNDSDFLTSCITDEALLLTCHGSVMYIHVLATIFPMAYSRNIPLVSNPNISSASARLNYSVFPKERAQQHIERQTRYWPLMESQTLLGKTKLAAAIFENLPKEYLEPNEISACKESIVNIVNSIKQHVCLSDSRKNSSKRGSSTTLPVAPTLQAEAIAMATEFDYILSLYSDISTEHEQIRDYWIQAINSSKTDISNGITSLSNENDFTSLNLTEMIRLAKTLACDQTDTTIDSTIPLALKKTMKSLTILCERLRVHTDFHDTKCTNQMNQQSTCNGTPSPKTMIVIEPANQTNFIDCLKSTKRQRTDVKKLDFVGVLTADSKGLCQLYKNLKDKEKSTV
ncbi:Integrator complex subunit 13 [Schistosoma japonicum]|uniref:Integrator complex subunit 13 n=1 Tax=Schistosoma japonicum TaxID=6182 RepID=A0A4Z2D131_SCHJA|nr:Integrator complex subunit 13 [Schistosoma japonicum]